MCRYFLVCSREKGKEYVVVLIFVRVLMSFSLREEEDREIFMSVCLYLLHSVCVCIFCEYG